MPWLAAWDVLGEELPPGVAPEEITFKPEVGNRRKGKKISIPEESPTKPNTGKESAESGDSESVDQSGNEKTTIDNLIDVDVPGTAPNANQNLDGTYYWIPEINGPTPGGLEAAA